MMVHYLMVMIVIMTVMMIAMMIAMMARLVSYAVAAINFCLYGGQIRKITYPF